MKNVIDNEIRNMIEEMNFKHNIKAYDFNNKKVLRQEYTNEILEMYSTGVSLQKIQKQITLDAISKNLIDKTIKRYSRKKGEANKIVEFETLFSMQTIKQIIKENDIEIQKVGRKKDKVKVLTEEEQIQELEYKKQLKELQLQKYKINAKIKALKEEYKK